MFGNCITYIRWIISGASFFFSKFIDKTFSCIIRIIMIIFFLILKVRKFCIKNRFFKNFFCWYFFISQWAFCLLLVSMPNASVGVGTKLTINKRGTFSASIQDRKKKKTWKKEKDKYYKGNLKQSKWVTARISYLDRKSLRQRVGVKKVENTRKG